MNFLTFLNEKKVKSLDSNKVIELLEKLICDKAFTKEIFDKFWKSEYNEYKDYVYFEKQNLKFYDKKDEIGFVLSSSNFDKISNLKYYDIDDVSNYISSIVNKWGWYISSNIKKDRKYYIMLRPNYGLDLIKPNPKYLYHITLVDYYKNIKSKGLIPKKGTRDKYSYPPRVFLSNTNDKNVLEKLRFAIETYNASAEDLYYGRIDVNQYYCLKIDVSKTHPGIKFFKDLDFPKYGVWTYTHIPKEAISIDYKLE